MKNHTCTSESPQTFTADFMKSSVTWTEKNVTKIKFTKFAERTF